MLLLTPACKDYLWGGTLLKERYGKGEELDIVAESWELSTHPDGLTKIAGGEESLRDYLKTHPAAGGGSVNGEGDLPLLVKLIDARKPATLLHRAHFAEEQKSLVNDLTQIGSFFRRGGKWISALELAGEGMDKAVEELGL